MANNHFFLKRSADFLHLREKGKSIRPSSWLLLSYAPNPHVGMRVGFTIPKKVGNAVIRNRLKRLGRAWVRNQHLTHRNLNVDINFVFRPMRDNFYKSLSYEKFSIFCTKGLSEVQRFL